MLTQLSIILDMVTFIKENKTLITTTKSKPKKIENILIEHLLCVQI